MGTTGDSSAPRQPDDLTAFNMDISHLHYMVNGNRGQCRQLAYIYIYTCNLDRGLETPSDRVWQKVPHGTACAWRSMTNRFLQTLDPERHPNAMVTVSDGTDSMARSVIHAPRHPGKWYAV